FTLSYRLTRDRPGATIGPYWPETAEGEHHEVKPTQSTEVPETRRGVRWGRPGWGAVRGRGRTDAGVVADRSADKDDQGAHRVRRTLPVRELGARARLRADVARHVRVDVSRADPAAGSGRDHH